MASTMDSAGSADRAMDSAVQTPDGWVLFVAVMILFTGIWNAVEGFIGFLRASYFIGSPVLGDLWIWALLWMAFGIVAVAAGAAIMSGRSWGRWFAIVVVGLNAFLHLLAIGTYPWWSLVVIVVDVLILYGLTVHWRREPAL
jgi:hypothetical protein